jgi:ribosomal protein L37AE/L43A
MVVQMKRGIPIRDAVCPHCNSEKVERIGSEWFQCVNCEEEFGDFLSSYEIYDYAKDYLPSEFWE